MNIGIVGYGNLGKSVEIILDYYKDMKLVGIFTRRKKEEIQSLTSNRVYNIDEILDFKDKIDVLILCGGSHSDLPVQGPYCLEHFNTVDSFDTHAKINDYFNKMNEIAMNNKKVGIISIGWDPGIFSLFRVLFNNILPNGNTYCFWGKGVSQGHSEAIRNIDGVIDAVQYTIPIESTVNKIKNGETLNLTNHDKHIRVCYVVIDSDSKQAEIEKKIKEMPYYFNEYKTIVNFLSLEDLKINHNKLFHGGQVIASNKISNYHNILELSIKMDSNPIFTAGILVLYARINYKIQKNKKYKAYTILDIPFSYMLNNTNYFSDI